MRGLWDRIGPKVEHPYSRRLQSLTICTCYYINSTFPSVILKPRVLIQLGFEPSAFHSADCACPIELTGSGKYSWLLSVVCKRQLSLSLLLSVYYVTLSAFWATFFIEYIPITVTLLPGTTFSVKYLNVNQQRFKIYIVIIIARRVHSFTCSGCKDLSAFYFENLQSKLLQLDRKEGTLQSSFSFHGFCCPP